MTDWEAVMNAIPAKPSRRGIFRSIPAEYLWTRRLLGRSLTDIASVYGRPAWYVGEPTTGGLTVGWKRYPLYALRFSPYDTCTDWLSRQPMESELSWRIRILNNMDRRTVAEILKWLGAPNSRTVRNDYFILQWQRPGYHIALRFGTDNRCTGIHEWSARPLRATR